MNGYKCSHVSSHTPKYQHGMNLLETAIVLLVIGLVVGGIWTAAAAARENLNYKRDMEGIAYTVSRMRAVFVRANQPASSNLSLNNAAGWAMGVYPPDWVTSNGIVGPDGTNMAIYLESAATVSPSFLIYFVGLSQSMCIKLVKGIWSKYNTYGSVDLVSLGISNGSGYVSYWIGTAAPADPPTECRAVTNNGLALRFSLYGY